MFNYVLSTHDEYLPGAYFDKEVFDSLEEAIEETPSKGARNIRKNTYEIVGEEYALSDDDFSCDPYAQGPVEDVDYTVTRREDIFDHEGICRDTIVWIRDLKLISSELITKSEEERYD